MIVLRLKTNGMFNFKDFDLKLSYPKRIANSTIGEEHLKGYPNFRFKKAIVLVGSNATLDMKISLPKLQKRKLRWK